MQRTTGGDAYHYNALLMNIPLASSSPLLENTVRRSIVLTQYDKFDILKLAIPAKDCFSWRHVA